MRSFFYILSFHTGVNILRLFSFVYLFDTLFKIHQTAMKRLEVETTTSLFPVSIDAVGECIKIYICDLFYPFL